MERLELTGKKFGRWTVVGFSHIRKGESYWSCICNCMVGKVVNGSRLNRGVSKSCGCLSSELSSIRNATHRMSFSYEYKTWGGMLSRCYNKKHKTYSDYGGRGIIVSKRWHKFENFYKDMGERPKNLSLDRINNDKGYSKENCRWATRLEQGGNKRNNIIYNGEYAAKASRRLGGKRCLVSHRITTNGWSIEKAFTTPVIKQKTRNSVRGD